MTDYYEVLQVSPEAEAEVIEAAYRRLARKYHPDVNPAADATARTQELNEAYEVLRDPARRAEYDAARRQGSATDSPLGHAAPGTEEADRSVRGLDDVPWWLGWLAIPISLIVPFGIFIYWLWAYRRGRRDGVAREPSVDPYRNFSWRVVGWLLTLFVPLLGLYAVVHLPTLHYKQGLRVGAKTNFALTAFTTWPALGGALAITLAAVLGPIFVAIVVSGNTMETRISPAHNGPVGPDLVRPTPSPFPREASSSQPNWKISEVMRDAKKQIILSDGLNVLTVDEELVDYEGWEIKSVVDMNGDGILDAVVTYFTGGMHCCLVYHLFASELSGIRLYDSIFLGNASIEAIEDLNRDGIPEIRALDDRLAYFPDLSFAASPVLPLVLCRSVQETYYDCTAQFPQFLVESAQDFERRLQDAIKQQQGEEWERSAALGLLATYLRLGDTEEGWMRVRALCPRCSVWLEENLSVLQERLWP